MNNIEVCERLMDYWTDEKGIRRPKFHAQIKGQPGYWGCGQTRSDAIGELMRNHPGKFGINIENLGKLPR